MWLPKSLLFLAAAILPLVNAQSSSAPGGSSGSPSATQSAQITVITSLSTSIGLGASRVLTTSVQTILITSTIGATTSAAPTSNSNPASSAASSTTTANLPTGTVSLVTDQAPSPGATGGPYGPNDGYISAAQSLKWSALLLSSGAVVGGLLAL
ncbi:hypothetical protein B0H11DRAFT_2014178 [Mycena galericulata]|nr:hypothetical protein B0H11DRAFT_2014178 [Mycena galericulata]